MIISHQYKYLFVELPRTGSTAISQELRENYAGKRILRKHSTYHDFLKIASPVEKKYFVFSCIRNPLDDAVSRYFKLRTDHRQRYTDARKLNKRSTLVERIENRLFHYIQETDADFQTFFLKYYVLPYNNWAGMARRDYDFVIRFENLQQDFAAAIQLIGIELKRPLPVRNATGERRKFFLTYYTPETIKRAKRIFGPFMQQWGYEFPAEWGEATVVWWDQLAFDFVNLFRITYWRHFRYRI